MTKTRFICFTKRCGGTFKRNNANKDHNSNIKEGCLEQINIKTLHDLYSNIKAPFDS